MWIVLFFQVMGCGQGSQALDLRYGQGSQALDKH